MQGRHPDAAERAEDAADDLHCAAGIMLAMIFGLALWTAGIFVCISIFK